MTAAIDLTIDRGADWLSDQYVWTDTVGMPVNISGCTATFKVAARAGDPSAALIISLTQSLGIALGGVAGTMQFTMPAAATLSLPTGIYAYDFFIYGMPGPVAVFKVMYGSFTIRGQVL